MSLLADDNGRPRVVYHGTRQGQITQFIPRFRKGEQLGFGIHFAFDESFARLYAEDPAVARKGRTPAVIAVSVTAKNPLLADVIVWEGSAEFALAQTLAGARLPASKDEHGRRGVFLQNAIDATSPQRAKRLIESAGYDGVIYRASVGSRAIGGRYLKRAESRSITVFSAEQITKESLHTVASFPVRVAQPRKHTQDQGPSV